MIEFLKIESKVISFYVTIFLKYTFRNAYFQLMLPETNVCCYILGAYVDLR